MSDLTEADIKKLKVVELKSELTTRGLATTGNKAVLVARLIEFVEESQNEEDEGGDTEPDEAEDTPVVEEEKPEEIAEPTVVAEPMEDAPVEEKEPQVEESSEMEASEEPTPNEEVKVEESMDSSEPATVEAAATEPEAAEPEAAEPEAAEPEAAEPEVAEPAAANEPEAAEPLAAAPAAADEKSEAMDTEASAGKEDEAGTTVDESKGNNTHSDESKEATGEEKTVDAETPKKDTTPKKTEERRSLNSRPPVSQKPPPPEDKGLELEEGVVAIDFFNSDVWMKIEDKGMTGSNRVESGFSQLWACGRTTYGFDSDKVCFAVKLKEKLECRIFENFGVEKCQFRVGVSVQAADMVLGMDDLSVAIDNFGKQYVEGSKGEAYYEKEKEGGRLDKDDIITVAIDTTENTVSFFKNKEQLGEAPITLPEGMRGQTLFPTIGTRNMPFTLITAATAEETFTPEGYTFIQEFEGKVRGPLAPVSREECEVVMMVGFPGSGKSTYVKKLVQDNPDKHYNILGTSYILKRMSDAVEARKKAKGGRIGYGMVNHAENMLRIVFDLAGRRARNFIIDQHNCQSAAQRRKLGYFNGGYKRRAVMIIPTEDVLKERVAGVPESEKPEDIPSDLHHEMKAYLTVPYIPEQVAEIEYVDGTEEEIKERVKKYNSDGQEYLKTHRKRRSFNGPRGGQRGYHNNNYHNNSPYRGGNQRYNNNNSGGGGYRDNRYSPYGNRGGYGGGGGYRGGYGGGGGGGYGGGNRGGYGGNYRGGYHNNNQGGGGGYQGGGGGGYQQQSGYRGNNRGSYRGKW